MEVRKIGKEQLDEALGLVWEVFLQFVAPDYSEEGIKSFRDFMKSEEMIASLEFFGLTKNRSCEASSPPTKTESISASSL